MTASAPQLLDRPTGRAMAMPKTESLVTVTASFSLLPGRQDLWLNIWKELGRLALSRPSCREFRLVYSRTAESRCSVVSTWNEVREFHRFVREIGLLWIERTAGYSQVSAKLTYSDPGNTA